MTITLPTTACRRDRAARLAHRRTPATEPVVVRVPAPRESAENLGSATPVRASRTDPRRRRIARNATRDDEMAAQGWTFAVESAHLRERAARQASLIDAGRSVDDAEIEAETDAVLRAFRSYEPFLGAGDRASNLAARRRLLAAIRAARARDGVGSAPAFPEDVAHRRPGRRGAEPLLSAAR